MRAVSVLTVHFCRETVAVTGETLEDVATLNQADIGITLGGRGDEGARYSSGAVCLDDGMLSCASLAVMHLL